MFKKRSAPKQLLHWASKAGLRLTDSWHREYFYFTGRGCRFMAFKSEDGWQLHLGEVHETFDKWWNSTLKRVPLPTTEKKFIKQVKTLSTFATIKYFSFKELSYDDVYDYFNDPCWEE